ncbi:MFS transporter [Streptomyces mexicanus]
MASAVASLVLGFGASGAWAIYTGRLITGVAVGIAMSVGSSWVKELSAGADTGLAARRAALCQTAGFALGAGVAGALAQWGPWPMVTPYVVHLLIAAAVPAVLLRVPETRAAGAPARAGGCCRVWRTICVCPGPRAGGSDWWCCRWRRGCSARRDWRTR